MRTLAFIAAALAIGAWAGSYWTSRNDVHEAQTSHPVAAGEAQLDTLADASAPHHTHAKGKHLYVCPMHPEVIQDHEGACPICGMDLVPAEGASVEEDRSIITISPEVTNNLSVQVTPVRRRDVERTAYLPAYIQGFTPGGTQVIRTNLAGALTGLKLKTGSKVHAGDVMFEIQVPGAKDVQEAHLGVLKQGDEKAIAESRMKLRELGMTGDDIQMLEMERSVIGGFRYRSPMDGQVISLVHVTGDTVRPGDTVLALQGGGATTVDVDIFQTEALWFRSGDMAELRVRQFPNQVWRGEVSLQGMRTNPEKRTYGLSIVFPMEQSALSNDMFGEVTVRSPRRKNVLTIPRDALIRTEGRNRVMVALGDGRFKPVEVQSGAEDGRYVEILSGLKEGDNVVVSSQFLLDSESSMRAEIHRMTGEDMPDLQTKPGSEKSDKAASRHMNDMGSMDGKQMPRSMPESH